MRGLCLLLAATAPTAALVVPLAGSRTPAVSHRVPTQAAIFLYGYFGKECFQKLAQFAVPLAILLIAKNLEDSVYRDP
ncbi:hypothetical protein EMIHUDRAFT_252180 [Emiliania huxleyi CCMP1516]|uniref:Uncharacterized protein n=2 Tax=Emiliania huxleyi TaxID=2903 RepID=A0A0D3KMX9_EMIH1|nr:hypothetical protein EMIHUDRAFT_234076 [Emiliania huxleyi CCMP1516]XP_005789543.1 hypothetical protein EMIHUDRAFT_252180 [Emiliania huxleyi CCMP1516]EOD29139.1 hypothetical protein EMIHUDRAFT_234076 [Emiliania huxleyi CCMP1516]EOD37114.1 hypothetical protein EMIHUDRAFT_252180 [Emiliania huxleyi CCMP1516]|eukprot:XP_005781568.1 hypothetical protein EMIHUDRAFT_234076 [Emiliania huxleyi CCMP1516]